MFLYNVYYVALAIFTLSLQLNKHFFMRLNRQMNCFTDIHVKKFFLLNVTFLNIE